MNDRTSQIDPWESSTWEGHARWQFERTLAATPLERLLWLEAAIELAGAAGAIPPRRPGEPSPAGD
ncbi:MAG: hypothetical protein ABI689_17655 [Thermoanaerobaculia bacterium]